MSDLLMKMEMDLQLRGYSPRTQETYLKNMRRFAKHFNKSPELLTEEDIREYLYYSISTRNLSCSFVNASYSAIKFFFETTLGRDWNMKNIPRIRRPKTLPVILSNHEIIKLFNAIHNLKHKTILMTIYAAGLRVSEAVHLKVADIDSGNMQIRIRQGKGNKDRYSILSHENLIILRKYYKAYHPKDWLFPNELSQNAITSRTVQHVFKDAVKAAGIIKDVSIHSLRHSFATHLLNNGVDLTYIQKLLGHTTIQTTSIYLHLTNKDMLRIISPLDSLLGDYHE